MAVSIWEGNKANELIAAINNLPGSGLSNDAKVALLNCFMKVAWVDNTGATLIQNLQAALFAGDDPTPVDDRIIYELTPFTDLNGQVIDTGVKVPTYNENFTVVAKGTLRKTSGTISQQINVIMFGRGGISEQSKATIRGAIDITTDGLCHFVSNYMYSDTYAAQTVPSNVDHEVIFVIRNSDTTVTKMVYADGVAMLNKTESASSYSSRTKGDNILIGGLATSMPTFDGIATMFRIYNAALTNSELETLLNISIS